MTQIPMDDTLREKIIADPEVLLEDADIMRALVAANDSRMGENVVDLRGIAMERLETRFDKLEDTHRSVIAAAYDNLAGTNQVHRAVLRLLDAKDLESFLDNLAGDVADILRVDAIRLVLETATPETAHGLGPVVATAPEGFVDGYITLGRNMPARQVTLRGFQNAGASLYGERAGFIGSEACLKLDLGAGNMPAMLLMGAESPEQFTPQHGTDLLTFFAAVTERAIRRWLV